MEQRIRVLYVVQGILPTGPGRHLFKLVAYRNRDLVDARVFAFDKCDPAMMATLEKDYGVQWQAVGGRFTHPKTYIRGWPRLLRQIDEFKPHIIQTHHTPIVDWAARLASKWRRVPLNLSRAVTKPKAFHLARRGVLGWWFTHVGDQLTNAWVDYYLANSVEVAGYMHEVEGIAQSKIITIPNGVDTEHFVYREDLRESGRKQLGIKPEGLLVVTIGHLKPSKGYRDLVEAALQLMPEFPQLRIAIVGKAWSASDEIYAQELRTLIANAGQTEKFLFLGELPDVRAILAAADIYAHPSYIEGSSNAVLEAMAMSRACVVSDILSSQELVPSEEYGCVVPQHQVPELAAALRRLLLDGPRREQLGKNAWRRAVEAYDVRRMCADLEAVYQRGLEEKGIHVGLPKGS